MVFSAFARLPVLRRLIPSSKKRYFSCVSFDGFILRRVPSGTFLLNVKNYVDRQLAFYDSFESAQMDLFFGEMAKGCDLYVDVGANIGLYSVRAARQGVARRILAFEPDTRNIAQLGANLLINNIIDRVEVVTKAVSSQAGTVSFVPAPPQETGRSRVDESGQGQTIECVALDDIIQDTGKRILIKMDIEGHELSALQGMRKLAANNKLFLQVESFQDKIDSVRALLAEMGLKQIHKIEEDHYFTNET